MGRLRKVEASKLSELWNKTYPHRYRIDAETVQRQILDCDLLIEDASFASETGFVAFKEPGTPNWFPGQDLSRAHMAAFAGSYKLGLALDILEALQFKTVSFGMDPDHLLPGCPVECEDIKSRLIEIGFSQGGEFFDLERDLGDYILPTECSKAIIDSGASVSPCKSEDVRLLDAFLEQEFPSRWRHDVMRKAQIDGEHDQIFLLWLDGNVAGFALTQQDGCKRPMSGANWRLDLGSSWGALGPIGVSKSVRGKGLGNALLGYSLLGLHERGSRQTIIDWTTLGEFYGAHGFEISRRYTSLTLNLKGSS